jgi:hypothetical protein
MITHVPHAAGTAQLRAGLHTEWADCAGREAGTWPQRLRPAFPSQPSRPPRHRLLAALPPSRSPRRLGRDLAQRPRVGGAAAHGDQPQRPQRRQLQQQALGRVGVQHHQRQAAAERTCGGKAVTLGEAPDSARQEGGGKGRRARGQGHAEGASCGAVALACKGPLNARLATGVGLSFFLSFFVWGVCKWRQGRGRG